MTLYKRYTQFLSSHYRYFIFISLFYSVWLVSRIYYGDRLELHHLDGRMIGEATVNGVDVGERVAIFYKCAFLFVLFNLGVCFAAMLLAMTSKKEQIFHFSEFRILNYTSLAGIIIYFYKLFFPDVDAVFDLIYALQKVALLLLVLKLFLWNDKTNKLFDIPLFSLLTVLSLSVFFFLKEIAYTFSGAEAKLSMFNVMSLGILLGYSVVGYLVRKSDYHEAKEKLQRFFWMVFPLSLIPVLSVLKTEIYVIFYNKGSHAGGFTIYCMLLLLLLLWSTYRFMRLRGRSFSMLRMTKPNNHLSIIINHYFAAIVVGLTAFLYYRPVIEPTQEMFEMAERALPLLEWQNFGTVPLIDKYSAHFLSDYFFGFIYMFFNGLHGLSFLVYDFVFPVIGSLLSYWLVKRLSGNAYVALFFVLFFPLGELVLPEYFSFAIIGIWVLVKFLEKAPTLKSYLLLFGSAAFLLLWRIDIGYPVVMMYVLIPLLYYVYKRRDFFNRKLLLRALTYSLALSLSLLLTLSLCGLPVWSTMSKTLSFLSSSQGYGYSELGDASTFVFKMQHYFLPLLLLLLLLLIVIRFRDYSISKRQRAVVVVLLCLGLFYIFNFQRGLVRHSFKEGADLFLSSFLFILLSGSVYLLFAKRPQVQRFLLFIGISTFLVFNYRLPANGASPGNLLNYRYNYSPQMACLFHQAKAKADRFPGLPQSERFLIDRCPESKAFKKEVYRDFAGFVYKHLKGPETFLDFSNSPMLYFFTKKECPSFFYHYPFHLCNEKLQQDFLEGMKNYQAPFAIMSHFPESWMDRLDGPPNSVKHYRMGEYLYANYEPFAIVQNYCIWKKKGDERFQNSSRIVFRYDSSETEKVYTDTLTGKTFFRSYVKVKRNKKYFFKVHYRSEEYQDIGLFYYNLPYSSTVRFVPAGAVDDFSNTAYFVTGPDNERGAEEGRFSYFVYHIKNIISLELLEADLLPDFYSTIPRTYALNKLPGLWASYDDSTALSKPMAQLVSRPEELRRGLKIEYKLPANLDKSKGNYALVKLRSSNTSTLTMKLSYGTREETKGEFTFTAAPGKEEKVFAVRLSTQYNWFSEKVNTISIEALPGGGEEIVLIELNILRGN